MSRWDDPNDKPLSRWDYFIGGWCAGVFTMAITLTIAGWLHL